MRAIRTFALTATALLGTVLPSAAQVNNYQDIKIAPLRAFSMPQPKRIQLPNGMVIFLMEDHELPLIKGSAHIRGGARDVPADKAGIASVYTGSWRTGGTESKTGDQLDDFLEARAAHVETGGDIDSTNVRFDVLKGDLDTVFPIFVELLQKPAFRQDKIDLAKTTANTIIARRNDDPGTIAAREASKLGYGADSPYARQPEYATIAAITRDDLLAFHKKFVHPNNIILGVVGDFDSAAMEKKLRATFASWPKGPQAAAVTAAGTPAKPGVYFIPKDDVTQTTILMVEPGGILKNSPDYHAVEVLNEIFGGGFSGRLMNDIRTAKGLAYGVGGGIRSDWDHPGLVRLQMGTKSSTTVEAIHALHTEASDLLTKPFTAEELQHAKDAILNAFVFTRDSKEKALNQSVLLEYYGYPVDFYTKYPAAIQAVTAADVARVAQKYVKPEQFALLVVGKEKEFDKPLSTLGAVQTIDITIPEPGAKPGAAAAKSAAAAPAGSNAEGKALAAKVREFAGGKAKLDSLASLRSVGSLNLVNTPQGPQSMETDTLVRFPADVRRVMKLPMGEVTMVVTSDAAFMMTPMGTQDMPGSQRESLRGEMKADMTTVLKNIDNPKYTFTANGTEKVGDVNAAVLDINADGTSVRWYVDPASGKVLRKVGHNPRGEQVNEYTEWKSFGGINFPVAVTITMNGEKSGDSKVTSIEVNPSVDEKAFVKP